MLPVLPFLSDYGWYVSFGLIVFYFLYQKYVTPIHKAAQYKEEEGLRKKYGEYFFLIFILKNNVIIFLDLFNLKMRLSFNYYNPA